MTLEERVRQQIGMEGPQHESTEAYDAYIDQRLEDMSPTDIIMRIGWALEEAGVKLT